MYATENDFLYQKYINDIVRFPLLGAEEEKVILQKAKQGCKKALDRLVCAHLRFVIKVACVYKGRGLPVIDLINEGNIGLMEALKRYDPSRNIKFTSYSVWWIRQAIIHALFKKARLVRISSEKELILRRIQTHSPVLVETAGGGRKINAAHVGKQMGYSSKQIEKILELGQHHSSLDAALYADSNTSYLNRLPESSFIGPEESANLHSLNNFLFSAMDELNIRERKIITCSFGLTENKPMNLREMADLFGLSRERIRQIKEDALEKMRNAKVKENVLLAACS
jgi:RNA polymerase primary sigma factor